MLAKQHIDQLEVNQSDKPISTKSVCMHVLTTVRTDARVLRSATALKEAGFTVSVVDIVDTYVQPIENIQGITAKHVKVSNSFLKSRFKRFAMVKALMLFARSILLLLKEPADIYHAHDFTALPACYIATLMPMNCPYLNWMCHIGAGYASC